MGRFSASSPLSVALSHWEKSGPCAALPGRTPGVDARLSSDWALRFPGLAMFACTHFSPDLRDYRGVKGRKPGNLSRQFFRKWRCGPVVCKRWVFWNGAGDMHRHFASLLTVSLLARPATKRRSAAEDVRAESSTSVASLRLRRDELRRKVPTGVPTGDTAL